MSDFYALQAAQKGGKTFDFETLKGKVVLIVNVASQWSVYRITKQLYELTDMAL